MTPNPYESPQEAGTKPAPRKWSAESKAYAALTIIALLFTIAGGGGSIYLDKMLMAITMMTTGIFPAAFFTVMLYRSRPDGPHLVAALLALFAAVLCLFAFAATLFIVFYLNIPLHNH